jgi:hypothetical protein
VALSRLTSLDGLVLYSPIKADNISTDNRVLSFIQTEQTEDTLSAILQAEQILFTNRMLVHSFEWLKMIAGMQELINGYDARKIPDKQSAVQWAQEILSKIRAHSDIAKKFSRQLKELLVSDAGNNYLHLKERVVSAQNYFDEQLLQLESLVHAHKEKYAAQKKVKKYKTELNGLINLIERKRKELKNAVDMADDLHRIKGKDQALVANRELLNTGQNQPAPAPGEHLHQ